MERAKARRKEIGQEKNLGLKELSLQKAEEEGG